MLLGLDSRGGQGGGLGPFLGRRAAAASNRPLARLGAVARVLEELHPCTHKEHDLWLGSTEKGAAGHQYLVNGLFARNLALMVSGKSYSISGKQKMKKNKR